MPRYPSVSHAGTAVPASIFARLREHLAKFPGDFIPLQIGDTHLHPPAILDEIAWTEPSDLYAYGAPAGWQPLVDALAARHRAAVQISCGATHALACAVQALCDPGDELILLTPHWPLIRGIALGYRVVPVEVPYDDLDAIARAITPRTAAIYYATPNNPDGAMVDAAGVRAIAELAERHGLWILADEVYEHYTYERPHASFVAPDRTVAVYSFAKSYAQAGMRIGYAVASESIIAMLRKLVNHSVYNVPVAMQRAAFAAFQRGDTFLAAARERYAAARVRARERLHAPAALPPGGAYLWVDFSRWTGNDCMPMLEKLAAAGVLLAPGNAFGDACGAFARLCFTGVPEERLLEGIDRINRVLEAW